MTHQDGMAGVKVWTVDIDTLTVEVDRHWLYQAIETGVALCTCGTWSFDANVGRAPLPTQGRFVPFSRHVAEVVYRLLTDPTPATEERSEP